MKRTCDVISLAVELGEDRETLKPCPFCGGDVVVGEVKGTSWSIRHTENPTKCRMRFLVTTWSKYIAIEKWNSRTSDERH